MVERSALLTPRHRGALARAPCVNAWSEVIRLAERRALRAGGQAIGTDTNVRLPLQVEWDVSRRARRTPHYVAGSHEESQGAVMPLVEYRACEDTSG